MQRSSSSDLARQKKGEVRKPEVHQYVDYVMTFEELQAMIDSKDIAVDQLPETELDTATYYGRVFARTGGLSEAVTEAVREQKAAAEAAKADAPDGAGASGAVASGEGWSFWQTGERRWGL